MKSQLVATSARQKLHRVAATKIACVNGPNKCFLRSNSSFSAFSSKSSLRTRCGRKHFDFRALISGAGSSLALSPSRTLGSETIWEQGFLFGRVFFYLKLACRYY